MRAGSRSAPKSESVIRSSRAFVNCWGIVAPVPTVGLSGMARLFSGTGWCEPCKHRFAPQVTAATFPHEASPNEGAGFPDCDREQKRDLTPSCPEPLCCGHGSHGEFAR